MPRDIERIRQRNASLKARYDHLYEEERLRFDDVINQLANEYFLMPSTVMKYLSNGTFGQLELELEGDEVDPAQLDIESPESQIPIEERT